MKLQTQIPLTTILDNHQVSYDSKTLLLGSCFVENMGDKLSYYNFRTCLNPFGILFNPHAIEIVLKKVVDENAFTENDIFFYQERWHCFYVHSSCSKTSKEEMLLGLNDALSVTRKFLKEATHTIITLGTAWVYRNLESNERVANCHKVPQKHFLKELLSIAEIEQSIQRIQALLRSVNPKLTLLYTVSPVRHIKDGFVENQRSKAHLLAALHAVLDKNKDNTYYFPSYELMMDELRDYRFYAPDMIHPNTIAIDYLWEKFIKVWISENCMDSMKKVSDIKRGLQHRPFNTASEQHKTFLTSLEQKITYLKEKYPYMNFDR